MPAAAVVLVNQEHKVVVEAAVQVVLAEVIQLVQIFLVLAALVLHHHTQVLQ